MTKFFRAISILCIFILTGCQINAGVAKKMLHRLKSSDVQNLPLRVSNINDYYPLTMKYVQKFEFDLYADEVLYYALQHHTIHHREIVNYYLTTLLKLNNKIVFDLIYMSHYRFIDKSHLQIFKYYHNDDPRFINLLSSLDSFAAPSPYGVKQKTAEYLNTIKLYIKDKQIENYTFYIENYISKVFSNITEDDKQLVMSLTSTYDSSSTGAAMFAWASNDVKAFTNCIENAIKGESNIFDGDEETFYYRMLCLQEMSKSLKVRRDFFDAITRHKNDNNVTQYFYLENLKHFKGYTESLPLMVKLAGQLKNQKSELARQLRFTILSQQKNISEEYIKDAIDYYNDFQGYRYSMIVLNMMVRMVMQTNSGKLLSPHIDSIILDEFTEAEKSYFYYDLYLIGENKDRWLDLLKQYPFNYPMLMINNGLQSYKFSTTNKVLPLSPAGKKSLSIVKSMLNYDLPNNINSEIIDNLDGSDKYSVYKVIATHFNKTGNSLMGIKYHLLKCDSVYQPGYADITFDDFLTIYPMPYKDAIIKYSKQHEIEPHLTYGIMREESRFVPDILSYVGATGLMQIMPSTGQWIAERMKLDKYDLKNPDDNIKMGTYYLDFLKYYTNDIRFIIAGYNAGPGKANRWLNDFAKYDEFVRTELIPIRETRNYVRRVMASYYIYEFLLNK